MSSAVKEVIDAESSIVVVGSALMEEISSMSEWLRRDSATVDELAARPRRPRVLPLPRPPRPRLTGKEGAAGSLLSLRLC